MGWVAHALAFGIVFGCSLLGTGLVRRILLARGILDHPNQRSSHRTPTARGGGIAVLGAIIPAWVVAAWVLGGSVGHPVVLSAAAVLAALYWLDDLRGVPIPWRLGFQAAAVAVVLAYAPDDWVYFTRLVPPVVDALFAGLLWIWFINLFNFMDGIDGISGVEATCIGLGVASSAWIAGVDGPLTLFGLTAAAAALGFLWWNWHPARIFLGDVGSAGLGFLLGWLLLSLAAAGQWAAALILPAYYLADATLTLLKRLVRGERVWRAHREHFYQQAVHRGASHGRVAGAVLLADLALVGLASAAAADWVGPALTATFVVVPALLLYLQLAPFGAPREPRTPAGRPP